MKPPYEITSKVLNLCVDISRQVGKCDGVKFSRPSPELRRHNRIRSIQSSLAIEGNTLSESQITDILNGKRIIGPAKDIVEVKNAIKAYDKLKEYDVYSLKSFLGAHEILMNGLMKDSGKFRSQGVGVVQGKKIIHMAPKHPMVFGLMKELFSYLKKETDVHLLIRSSVFHYEMEFIHPFSDGNGRMGRLWQTAIICKFHPVFEFIPVEALIKKRQREYYKTLEMSNKRGNSTVFIEFMLEAIKEAIEEFVGEIKGIVDTPRTRLDRAKQYFGAKEFSRIDYLKFHKTVSAPTASRDLLLGVKEKVLSKTGKKALTKYVFIHASVNRRGVL
ncbi:MAG: Fic family protein [Candidatus Omnitrophica bacterium]|nr:Fic family protein [Candidatus Omnitrophota bacterium]